MSSSADSHSTNSFWGHSESLHIKQPYYYSEVFFEQWELRNGMLACLGLIPHMPRYSNTLCQLP